LPDSLLLASGDRLQPVIASEIEFYLHGASDDSAQAFFSALRVASAEQQVGLYHIEKERGASQYEVALTPVKGAAAAASQAAWLRSWLQNHADDFSMTADFSAKPLADQPGSGLHIHLHLEDETGRNVFVKNDAMISDALRWSLGGLLACMLADMPIFAPSEASYLRFQGAGDHTPTTISWGANNRTCALRLPDTGGYEKHIEHRVAGADADPASVIASIIAAVDYGLREQLDPGAQVYGRAQDAVYNLPRLPLSLSQALKLSASSPLRAS